jgi:hypothetical protein
MMPQRNQIGACDKEWPREMVGSFLYRKVQEGLHSGGIDPRTCRMGRTRHGEAWVDRSPLPESSHPFGTLWVKVPRCILSRAADFGTSLGHVRSA